ncbi:hypothetical protein Asi02nite_22410 [Asanoa siamensis]|uniref:Uncharacterized protein n=1 Tax=Asanoa siamensis TaxID=926357 RepID=A0ABQ4CN55_9ACTN|nr:hypothetical protein Asi02nite_22410 [Asanoa siamensis]
MVCPSITVPGLVTVTDPDLATATPTPAAPSPSTVNATSSARPGRRKLNLLPVPCGARRVPLRAAENIEI